MYIRGALKMSNGLLAETAQHCCEGGRDNSFAWLFQNLHVLSISI